MKKACLLGLAAAITALLTGCGSSSSDDNNGGIKTTNQPVDSYCLNYPNDPACQSNNNGSNSRHCNNQQGQFGQGSQFNTFNNGHSSCYPTNSNGQYVDSQFGFANGACYCQSGFMPIRNQAGQIECLRRTTVVQTDWLLTVSFSSGSHRVNRNGNVRRGNHRDFNTEFVLNQGGQTIDQIVPGNGNCYQQLPVGCSLHDPYGSCAHVSQSGAPAVCVATNGGNSSQGLCVNQSIPTR